MLVSTPYIQTITIQFPPLLPPSCHKPTMLIFLLFILHLPFGTATRCTPVTSYTKCVNLPTQEATLSWTYHPGNSSLHLVFSNTFISPTGWVGFGINPTSPQMTGARSLIAFSDPASGSLALLPFLLDPSVKLQSSPLLSRPLDLPVLSSSASLLSSHRDNQERVYVKNGAKVFIHATLKLNPNHTKINLVWNRGLYVQGYSPTIHPTATEDLSSRAIIDLLSSSSPATSTMKIPGSLRAAHAVLNALSWGFLLPIGVVIARYLRQCPNAGPTWFYAHAMVQIPGFLLGSVGFVIGIVMGDASEAIVYGYHRGLGIGAFCMGGLQVMAMAFRPGTESRMRKYWKSYHHLVGYGCVVVGVVNVFQGLDVMGLGRSWWKLVYCLVLSTVIGACVGLEANAWVVFCRKAEEEKVRREGNEEGEMMKGNGSSL